ncbi:MAG TPA: MmgE/PrpD family protein [Dehalococcoidia bacterium]|nr:MmgE/PrpD family protein [Dehalococcoidia bacterium]
MPAAQKADEIGPTRKVAEFVHGAKLADIPPAAIENAKLQILDTIGIGLAALDQPVAKSIQRYVRAMGGEPVATVLGMEGYKTSPPQAALANGAFFNILDLDNHTATFVLPAVLAIGEMIGASGEQVLEAYIVAAEASTRIDHTIDAARPNRGGPTFRGWYHVSILGPMGAAIAASKLLEMDVDQTRGAIGAAACSSGGVRQNMGRKAKSLFAGNSASLGVAAALLARDGVTGDPDILEGRLGIVSTLCLPNECDWSSIMSRLGNPYQLSRSVSMTRYPAIGAVNGMITALARMREAEALDVSQIASIEARVVPSAASALTNTGLGITEYPDDELGGESSWCYALAATLVDGSFTVDHLSIASVNNPRIRELASKVALTPLKAWSDERESISVRLRDGRTLTAEKGPTEGPATREDFVAKFRDCAQRHFAAGDADTLYQRVMAIETLSNISELTAVCAAGATR